MKPITGEVISSKPIALSKAAAVLAKFASSENGATPEISEYLLRASASFGELVEYYRRFEGRKNVGHGHEKEDKGDVKEDGSGKRENGDYDWKGYNKHEGEGDGECKKKSHKKKRDKRVVEDEYGDRKEDGDGTRKKRDRGEGEGEGSGHLHRKKKKMVMMIN